VAQLPDELDDFILEVADTSRGFLLRLSDPGKSTAAIVDGLVLQLLSCADRIVFPGYRQDWLRHATSPPRWALALDQRLRGGRGELSATDAIASDIRDFWRTGDFVERMSPSRVQVYRAAVPVLMMNLADSLRCLSGGTQRDSLPCWQALMEGREVSTAERWTMRESARSCTVGLPLCSTKIRRGCTSWVRKKRCPARSRLSREVCAREEPLRMTETSNRVFTSRPGSRRC
jgi:hypothetical protein